MSDDNINHEELQNLRSYIEENLRTSTRSGFKFIDTRGLKDRIRNKQNHVVFGRRGSGKSSLLQELLNQHANSAYIDLEDYKDITFPNIVLYVLTDLLEKFNRVVTTSVPFWRKLGGKFRDYRRQYSALVSELRSQRDKPDIVSEQVKSKQGEGESHGVSAGVSASAGTVGVTSQETLTYELETCSQIEKSKLEFLKTRLTDAKRLLKAGTSLLEEQNRDFFLILDDFYFIPVDDQPFLIDYVHRLTKETDLYFKLATIKHRTKLYTVAKTYYGIELGSDAVEIDLDYTFDDFQNLQQFMHELLTAAIKASMTNLSGEDLFSGDGFKQLCIASGGVPRDFLSIFVKAVTKSLISDGILIGKVQVTEEAIANLSNKMESIRRDSKAENQLMEIFIFQLRDFVFGEKRTNCFLIQKDQLEANVQIKQAIRELFDLRLIHILDKNASSGSSNGKSYEAYLIDVGLYENAHPRKFTPVEPGISDPKSRREDFRASPRIDVEDYHRKVKSEAQQRGVTQELTMTIKSKR